MKEWLNGLQSDKAFYLISSRRTRTVCERCLAVVCGTDGLRHRLPEAKMAAELQTCIKAKCLKLSSNFKWHVPFFNTGGKDEQKYHSWPAGGVGRSCLASLLFCPKRLFDIWSGTVITAPAIASCEVLSRKGSATLISTRVSAILSTPDVARWCSAASLGKQSGRHVAGTAAGAWSHVLEHDAAHANRCWALIQGIARCFSVRKQCFGCSDLALISPVNVHFQFQGRKDRFFFPWGGHRGRTWVT